MALRCKGEASVDSFGLGSRSRAEGEIAGDLVTVAVGNNRSDRRQPAPIGTGVCRRYAEPEEPGGAGAHRGFRKSEDTGLDEAFALVKSCSHLICHRASGLRDDACDEVLTGSL